MIFLPTKGMEHLPIADLNTSNWTLFLLGNKDLNLLLNSDFKVSFTIIKTTKLGIFLDISWLHKGQIWEKKCSENLYLGHVYGLVILYHVFVEIIHKVSTKNINKCWFILKMKILNNPRRNKLFIRVKIMKWKNKTISWTAGRKYPPSQKSGL